MDRLHYRPQIFKNIEIVKSITTALKGALELVKLQSLVAKCCKMKDCKIRKLGILLYYVRKTGTTIGKTVLIFGHIFHILQHLAAKLSQFS